MGSFLIAVLGLSGYILPIPSLIWGWTVWFKSQPRFGSPVWRFVTVFIGLAVASVIGLFVLFVIIRVGGKGSVRLPASLGSFGLAAFWLVAALLY